MSFSVVAPKFQGLKRAIDRVQWLETSGRVTEIVGLVIESDGPNARVGDLCWINPGTADRQIGETLESTETSSGRRRSGDRRAQFGVPAEVVGFRGDRTLLMPLGEISGVRPGCRVTGTGTCLRVPVGPELLGRVVDALGQPMDGGAAISTAERYPISAAPPGALERKMIELPLATGVRAIDGLLTLGEGQRIGIFAGSGVGKSTLLGMVARNCRADVNVIALVGERGREVREFIEHDLGEEGLARSVIVCATSDQPALLRIKAAMSATAIAEYFRDQGLKVVLMMDSVTRFAMAQREVGLAVGEPPSTKGYTPSVFALLPKLMERAGNGSKGSITALYTVLVEGDDTNEPIADATRAILDGHIVLSRKLTSRGHYPPIDIMTSLSRTMPMVVSKEQLGWSRDMRELMANYHDIEDLVSIGAYKPGSRPASDRALERWDAVNAFLRQDKAEASSFEETLAGLEETVGEQV